jgi:hypothetical protein
MVKKSIEEIQARPNRPNNKRGNSRKTRVYGDEKEPATTTTTMTTTRKRDKQRGKKYEELQTLDRHPFQAVTNPSPPRSFSGTWFQDLIRFQDLDHFAHEIKQRSRSLSTGATCRVPRITRRSWSWSLLLPNPCDVYDRTDGQD